MTNVSATHVENGPPEDLEVDVGAIAWRRDDCLTGVIGCRLKDGGEEGGVSPDPEGGSSVMITPVVGEDMSIGSTEDD